MPILGYGLATVKPNALWTPAPDPRDDVREMTFAALLAKVLIVLAIDFEAESPVSLAIGAKVLRLVDSAGVRVRDLPGRSGILKEAVAMSCGFLQRHGHARVGADPSGSRFKVVTLTPSGQRARESYQRFIEAVDLRWNERYGESCSRANLRVRTLRDGIQPYPDGWRARVRAPSWLPHFPTVLHRGGYPDGS